MKRVVVLAEAAADLEEARAFYEARETGVGDYWVTSLLEDIESLARFHGMDRRQYGCFRRWGNRFPFGIYYLVVEELVNHFETTHRALPTPRTRPMQKVA